MVCLAAAPKNGMQILDACAAPGGKSCLMAEMMQGTGRVQAWELHPHRADLIAAQVQRLGLENVRPMTRDALKHREELDGTMDIVLLDAPCSGLGVMSEKPDVKYRVTAQSVDELVQLQSNLLDAVCPYVKKGGTLVYSTCSVLKDENVRQAEKFLARHPEFELLPLPETIPASVRPACSSCRSATASRASICAGCGGKRHDRTDRHDAAGAVRLVQGAGNARFSRQADFPLDSSGRGF